MVLVAIMIVLIILLPYVGFLSHGIHCKNLVFLSFKTNNKNFTSYFIRNYLNYDFVVLLG